MLVTEAYTGFNNTAIQHSISWCKQNKSVCRQH